MTIKGAIFDMDGTIIDSLSFWEFFWKLFNEEFIHDPEFRPSDEVSKQIRTMIFADAIAYIGDYYGLTIDAPAFAHFATGGLREFYKTVATIKEGADRLLAALKAQNVKLCLASAAAMPEILFALEHYGLLPYFDHVVSCADLGAGKDRPDVYLEALRLMALPVGDACVFEDSCVALETAKAAGFRTVGIFDRHNSEQERLKRSSDVYLEEGRPLDSLLAAVHA